MKKDTKSPASLKLPSGISHVSMTPNKDSGISTIGMRLSTEDARKLGAMLSAISYDREYEGEIIVTGYLKEGRITVLRRK